VDYCFDTSAVNALHDDPIRARIVASLLADNRALVTEFNFFEVLATKDMERRVSLVTLLKDLAAGTRPLLSAPALVRRLAIAHRDQLSSMEITTENQTVWQILHDPREFLDEESRLAILEQKTLTEDRFRQINERARIEIRSMFPGALPRTFGGMLRFFAKNPICAFDSVARPYQAITGRALSINGMLELFVDIPEWPLFMSEWAHGLYSRALQERGCGKRNTGAFDLMCAVYLEHCDRFVTADGPQYRALRVINAFLPRRRQPKPKVVFYKQFSRAFAES
jgi:hypothetical protein